MSTGARAPNDRLLELRVTAILDRLGLDPALSGYRYIPVVVAALDGDLGALAQGRLGEAYRAAAQRYGSTYPRVERAIRHAIITILDQPRGDISVVHDLLGPALDADGRAHNGSVLFRLLDLCRDLTAVTADPPPVRNGAVAVMGLNLGSRGISASFVLGRHMIPVHDATATDLDALAAAITRTAEWVRDLRRAPGGEASA